ncbi:hypothetical protein AHF37_08762 [Paragonimus kellicotti]|nr:hypothetical protein AHF37_08762 [Paragonimus kellicotti]
MFKAMSSVENRLNDYKEKTKLDGEELVRNVFPKRVFEMEELLASELFGLGKSVALLNRIVFRRFTYVRNLT